MTMRSVAVLFRFCALLATVPHFILVRPCLGFGIGVKQQLPSIKSVRKMFRRFHTQRPSSPWGENGSHHHPEEVESAAFSLSKDAFETDWLQAELTLLNAPLEPHPHLSADTVAITCLRSLQWVDHPTPSCGLARCYPFFTFACREVVTARRGGKTVESFTEYGLYAPALQPFMGASRLVLGDGTYTPPHAPLRGALSSFPVQVHGAPVLTVQHPSGMDRAGVASQPPVRHMVIRLEQQRRPPHQGCWMVCELLDVRHAFAGDMGNVHVGG